MNELQKNLITLLKSAVTGRPGSLTEGFELEQAMPLIRKHSIVTLVYEGAVLCGIPRQDPVMRQLFASYCKATLVSEGQLSDIEKLYKAFDEAQIDYMPLKGCRMKTIYPRPELRPMGDADILIRMEQYDRIKPILTALGFEDVKVTDHELIWKSGGLFLELHKRLIPSYNGDFYSYYEDGWKLAKNRNKNMYFMDPEDEWIYLFTHFAKHYRDGGIGCRHVLDLWIWQRNHPDMDRDYIDHVLQQLHLDVFCSNILRLINVWFEDGKGDALTDFLTESIFSSGSFGEAEIRALSIAVRNTRNAPSGFHGRLQFVRNVAFPDVQTLRNKYTILKKAPWMLPGVWIVRPFYKVIYERKSIKRKTDQFQIMSKENIDTRREMLNLVGLDYHF